MKEKIKLGIPIENEATEESYQLLECTAKELSDGFNIEDW